MKNCFELTTMQRKFEKNLIFKCCSYCNNCCLNGCNALMPSSRVAPIVDESDIKGGLTKTKLLQCQEDLRSYYLNKLCFVQTDPIDHKSILDLEDIYANLTVKVLEWVKETISGFHI